jgi:hypothetical protein
MAFGLERLEYMHRPIPDGPRPFVEQPARSAGPSPDATAFAFGAMLQREYGSDWARLIGIASQAAMNADHGIVDPCFSQP